jgi:nitrile hydratase accessory protein
MLMRFEHFAVTTMMGSEDSPPRNNGALCFGQEWERTAFGIALGLSRAGYFEWEDFRQQLIAAIARWETSHAVDDDSWNYYECWLAALEATIVEAGLLTSADIAAALGGTRADNCGAAPAPETATTT